MLTDEIETTRPVDDIFRSLPDEELKDIKPITSEQICEALRQGREEARACEPALYARKGYYF